MAAATVAPVTPAALRLTDALERSAPLVLLRQRLRESDARFEAVRAVLPSTLVPHVRPGSLDAEGWTLVAANTGVAAKLRQLQPRLEAALQANGWVGGALRIKVGIA